MARALVFRRDGCANEELDVTARRYDEMQRGAQRRRHRRVRDHDPARALRQLCLARVQLTDVGIAASLAHQPLVSKGEGRRAARGVILVREPGPERVGKLPPSPAPVEDAACDRGKALALKDGADVLPEGVLRVGGRPRRAARLAR